MSYTERQITLPLISLMLLLLLLWCGLADANDNVDEQVWITLKKELPLFEHSDFSSWISFQNRYSHNDILDRHKIEFGLSNQLTESVSGQFGYEYLRRKSSDQLCHEQRFWQQVKWTFFQKNRFKVTSRSRLTLRDRAGEEALAVRFHQRFNCQWPSKRDSKITPVIYSELFANLNQPSWVSKRGMFRHRGFIGLKLKDDDGVNWTVGYLNSIDTTQTLKTDHILTITISA